jgi:hypothetical protein
MNQTEQLQAAKNEAAKAFAEMSAIKAWGAKKREAAERYNFWTNKVAFLSAVKLAA